MYCGNRSASQGILLLAAAACVLASSGVQAQGVYHNQRLFVVPAPGKVTVDGDLADWDLSGEIYTYVIEATSDFQSARTAMMYDADALYISSRVADPSPMLNKADPGVNPDFGWDGDAFQFRLCLDPALGYPLKIGGYDRTPNENLVHMTLWYYTDGKKPVLHAKFGMDYHDAHGYHKGIVPADKFEAAYVPWKDGKGYTFEYRVPWATLVGQASRLPVRDKGKMPAPLKAGDLAAAAIQIQWSDATGAHSYGGGWAVDLMRHAGFSYQSTGCWGKAIFSEKGHLPKELTQEGLPPVRKLPLAFQFDLPKECVASVTLINGKGDRVRNVVAAASRPGGRVIERWDGLDSAGRVLPPGEYTWKGAYHEPFKTRFVLSVDNAGTPSYNTPDGKGAWGGDWGCPSDVAFAGDRGVLVWDGSEAGTGLIGVDANGRKTWGYRIGGSYLATDGEWAYVYLGAEKQIRAYGVADGKQIAFLRGDLWAEHNAQVEPEKKAGAKKETPPAAKVPATLCTGLAFLGGKLYVANAEANEVVEYAARQGKILRRLSVPKPTGLCATAGLSSRVPGGTVGQADRGTEKAELFVLSDGALHKLSLADGKLTPFAKDHLDEPQYVAAGPDGTVFVSNGGKLQNVSVFGKDGSYQRSIGKAGGRAMADPPPADKENLSPSRAGKWDSDTMLNPRGLAVDAKGRLWVAEHDFQPKRFSLWDAATGKLVEEKFGPCYVSTPVCMDPADPTRVYCQNVEWAVDLDKGTWKPAAVMIEAKPDTPYFWPHGVNNMVFTARNGKQYMSAQTSYGLVRGDFLWVRRGDHFEAAAGVISPWAGLSWRQAAKGWEEYVKVPWLFWEDTNGDGVIQRDETRFTPMKAQGSNAVVDADLNLYATGMYNELYWQRISPKSVLENGVPLYDDASIVRFNYGEKHAGNYTYDLAVNPADGSVLMYAGTDIKLLGQTELWPISYWTKDGQLVWRFREGCRWHDMYEFPIPKPGQLFGCTRNMGITDGITGYSCYFGAAQLLTTDGVPLGTITKDGRSGEAGPDVYQCEWFTGQLAKISDGRWFLLAGDQDGRVLQVEGLDTVRRFEGKLTITEEDTKAAAAALAEWSSLKAKAQSLVLARCDGKPNWMDIRGVTVTVDAHRGFTVKAAYDAQSLYLSYEVSSPSQLTNSTPETQMLFKGGNCLDIQIATNPAADPERDKPAPGDLRVLVTRRNDRPVATVYRPKVAGFKGDPVVFTSPTGKEAFDTIETWENVALDYAKTETGFTAVVSLPLAKIGLAPRPGTALRMDVGYLFGNETGNATAVRAYWSNHSFSAGVTQDVPNEARLEPKQWGAATVE